VVFIKLWRSLNATNNCTECLNTYFVMGTRSPRLSYQATTNATAHVMIIT